jgi:4-amino-4-deoxy-L-arabinose transferase-like glycosyltransferase
MDHHSDRSIGSEGEETWREPICKNRRRVILLLLVGGFALRLVSALTAEGISQDGIAYLQVARAFIRGDILEGLSWPPSYPFLIPPFYPFLIALLSAVVPDPELAGRLVSVAAGTLLIVPGYVLASRMFGTDVGLLSAFFLATAPRLLQYGGDVLTESIYILLATAAVERGWVAIEGRRVAAGLSAGLFTGLAYLTRPEAGGILLVLCAWLLGRASHGSGRRGLLAVLGALAAGFLPFFVPYVLLIHSMQSTWMVSGKSQVGSTGWIPLAGSLLIFLMIAESIRHFCLREKYATLGLLGGLLIAVVSLNVFMPPRDVSPVGVLIAEGPLAFFRAFGVSLLWEAKRFPEALSFVPFLLFLIGVFGRSAVPYRPQGEAYLRTIILFYLALFPLFLPRRRYLVQLLPYLLPWAGVGIMELRERVKPWLQNLYGPRRGEELARKGMVTVLLLILLTHAPFGLWPAAEYRGPEKEIGLRLRPLVRPDTIIMSDRAQAAYYAGATSYPTPQGSFASVLADARSHGVEYWLVRVARVPAEWGKELEAAEQRGDLVRIDSMEAVDGEPLVVFRLAPMSQRSGDDRPGHRR